MKTSRAAKGSKNRKRKPRRASNTGWLDALDAVNDRFTNIATVTGLLEAVDDPETLNARLAANAGSLIAGEMRQVKALVDQALEAKR